MSKELTYIGHRMAFQNYQNLCRIVSYGRSINDKYKANKTLDTLIPNTNTLNIVKKNMINENGETKC